MTEATEADQDDGARVVIHQAEYVVVPIDSLVPHPDNARDDNPVLRQLLEANGFLGAVLTQAPTPRRKRDRIIAGEHRWRELKAMGATEVPILRTHVDDDTVRRHLVGDNAATDKASYVQDRLVALLTKIKEEAGTLHGTGWDAKELQALTAKAGSSGKPPESKLLNLEDVTDADPEEVLASGTRWVLGDRHLLVVADVITNPGVWARWLTEAPTEEGDGYPVLFVPYPGPYVPHVSQALDRRLVMVQPDGWIAGHLVDKWRVVHGDTVHPLEEEA